MKRILLGLVAILVLGVFVSYNRLGGIIETGVEEFGPDVLKVDVGLDGVKLDALSGALEVTGLTIGQPQGFGEGSLASIGNFDMKLETATLLSDHIIIDTITIDAPAFDVRIKEDGLTNIQALQNGLDLPVEAEAAPAATENESEVTLTIRSFAVKAPKLAVKSDRLISIDDEVSLADFTLTNLGTDEEGLAPSEIARHIMDTLQPQIAKALIEIGAGKKVRELANKARGTLEKGVGGVLGKLDDKVGGALKDSGLKEKVGGFLGKLGGKKKDDDDGN